MASGDAQKVWFPELMAMVRQAGDSAMSIDALLRLRDRLDTTLQTIRHTRQILPAMIGSTEQRYVKFRSSTKGCETLVKTHAISPRTPICMKKTSI